MVLGSCVISMDVYIYIDCHIYIHIIYIYIHIIYICKYIYIHIIYCIFCIYHNFSIKNIELKWGSRPNR